MFQKEDTSSMAKSRPPTGAPKAEAIPKIFKIKTHNNLKS
jgi:hypothetical protein